MEGVVGTLRLPLQWSDVERQPGIYDFESFDTALAGAARHGIEVMPFVYATPAWLDADPARPPLATGEARRSWAAFLRQLVERYGPAGRFWRGRSARTPIRRWQIWNEPNFRLFWHPQPSPNDYARLLAISAQAIRGADRNARIVLAGVAPVSAGLMPWVFLRRFYRVADVKRSFDLAAVHPYATSPPRMAAQIRAARHAMRRAGDASTPLLVSEVGVASHGQFPSAFVKGERGQAEFLRSALDLLLARRRAWRIAGVDWFTWRDSAVPDRHCSFCEGAGLFDPQGRPKEAWRVFRGFVGAAIRPNS